MFFNKLKSIVFFFLYACLWGRFFLMIWDPTLSGHPADVGLAVYRDFRTALDWYYWLTYVLTTPVYMLYGWIAGIIPKIPGFPGMYTASALEGLLKASAGWPESMGVLKTAVRSPFLRQAMLGYIDWLTLMALVLYRCLEPLLDAVVDFVKNFLWGVLIEMSFSKRKESRYQDALTKRAGELMKLNVEYKTLSNEASMLAESVVTDELTKVYNKRFFIEKISYEFEQARQKKSTLAIAMVDIDHFKKLNDTYGHLFGDTVLKAVARAAKESTPKGAFCCRFGGEEFAIIMPGKGLQEAVAIVSSIHKALPTLTFDEQPTVRTSASFGMCVADFSLDEAQALTTFESFIKLADDELYRAKLNGRNRVETKAIVQPS